MKHDIVSNTSVSRKEYFGYFSYGFGQCFAYGLVGNFIVFFYTEVLGITLAASGIIFLIARVWDAVNDPIIAGMMDTRQTKEGKFKGYLKWVPLLVLLSTVACFFAPNVSMNYKILYAALTYLLWGTVYTVSDIPFWSLSAVISEEPGQRTRLVTCANLGVFAGIGAVGTLIPHMVKAIGNGDNAKGYLISVLLVMVLGFAFMMFGHSTVKERVALERKEKATAKDVVQSLFSNKYLFQMLLIFFMNIFMNMVNGIMLYFFKFNLGDESLYTIYGLFGTFSALGFFVIPKLAEHFPKKKILMGIIGLDILCRLLFYFVGYANMPFLLAMLFITQLFHACIGPLMSTMIAETIEYAEARTGKRCEAITFSGQTFTGKLAAALGGLFVTVVLGLIAFEPQAASQSPQAIQGIFVAISLVPIVGDLIRLLILFFYRYTEVEYEKDVEILRKRRVEGMCR